jgi:4-hydroxy-L-threonine phosphate dehydrogenase PdxA
MKIYITLGDPAGIGPEIILKSLSALSHNKDIKIYGNKRILKKTAQDMGLSNNYRLIHNIIYDCTSNIQFRYGNPTRKTGQVAMQSLNCALNDAPDVLITPPIVKDVIRHNHPGFCGHTEYLANFFKTKKFAMVGIWRNKRIMLLTTHLALRDVLKKITSRRVLQKIILLDHGLQRYFGINHSSIGVSSLNPHAHEFSLGEDEKIQHGIELAATTGINCHGPYPADSLFDRTFDGFLAIYHDQAMIYLKSKKDGLNFTLGLPLIRLSPLYGAALDIAGKNRAEASGLTAAINMGIKLYKNVRRYEAKNKCTKK